MFAVAIARLSADPDAVARELQRGSGRTLYEERARIGRSFPRVIATCPDRESADRERAALAAAGARAVVIDCEAIERDADRLEVRGFELTGTALSAEVRGKQPVTVTCAEIATLIRGLEIERSTQTSVTRKRKLSAGRAIMTGGLMTSKKVSRQTTTRSERRGAYLLAHVPNRPTLVLRESSLVFSGMGDAMQPSRAANFEWLVGELRRRAPRAAYDERLLTHAGLTAVLGSLDAELYGDLAIALVAYDCWLDQAR